ncbi:MAG TPA: OmpA family protein, partial [Polyangiaceae bacterium]|nr:OmpA family protein [Polyangiaceae bacterium]
ERGPDWFNERLSQTRADAVLAFLVAQGVPAQRLSAKGFGKSKPLVEKRTEYAYYMNRRVEFEITRELRKKNPDATPSRSTSEAEKASSPDAEAAPEPEKTE